MSVTYEMVMKIVAYLSIRDDITEGQIRSYLVTYDAAFSGRISALVSSAPAVAEAVYNGTQFKLKVDSSIPGQWEIYPKGIISVTVADGITLAQVRNYLESFWDQFKTDLKALVANAPAAVNAEITEWHVHRLSGSVDEVE